MNIRDDNARIEVGKTPSLLADSTSAALGDIEKLPDESQLRSSFGLYDMFFWRDVPDWYRKTFLTAAFGFSLNAYRQYVNRHELEVFMPPRAKILPENMREGYWRTQRFKAGLFKVGRETLVMTALSGMYFSSAYYLGRYRGVHDWMNFAAGGSLGASAVMLSLLRPVVMRTTLFGAVLGGFAGATAGKLFEVSGQPMWDESHDFEGYWFGQFVDKKVERREQEKQKAQATQVAS